MNIVLVNGHLGDVTTGKTSALSILAALFATTKKASQVAVLYYSCDLHSRQGNPTSGLRGLVQSLLAHMVIYLGQHTYESTTFLIIRDKFLQDATRGDIVASCLLFSDLVTQLGQNTTVYCVIGKLGSRIARSRPPSAAYGQRTKGWAYFENYRYGYCFEQKHSIHQRTPIQDQIWLNADNILSDSVQPLSFEHEL
ncbi:hypothetical protein GGS26DRAFT_540714 [Hypomontagnella submonticulosa]|nr:hypothetical protein GGS26DRAFT_540714 [Hypomontagnella submonticulosa]